MEVEEPLHSMSPEVDNALQYINDFLTEFFVHHEGTPIPEHIQHFQSLEFLQRIDILRSHGHRVLFSELAAGVMEKACLKFLAQHQAIEFPGFFHALDQIL